MCFLDDKDQAVKDLALLCGFGRAKEQKELLFDALLIFNGLSAALQEENVVLDLMTGLTPTVKAFDMY